MKFGKALGIFGIALAGVGLLATHALASTTFANFTENGTQAFVFTNTGATSTFSSTPISVNFFYQVANGLGTSSSTPIAANLVITGTVSGAATPGSPSNGGNITQNFGTTTLTFTDIATGQTLLSVSDSLGTSMNASPPAYGGGQTGGGGQISSSTSAFYPQAVTYGSSYLAFPGNTEDNFSLTFSSLTDTATGDTTTTTSGPTVNGNGYLDSFAASGVGTFACTPPPVPQYIPGVPEPSSLIAVGIAASGLFGLLMFRKKQPSLLA
jgi:hypothetical protein